MLDCKQIFCAGCCLHTTFNLPPALVASFAGDALQFVKVCPDAEKDVEQVSLHIDAMSPTGIWGIGALGCAFAAQALAG